ncbi:DUF1934 domain-containing protein [Cytobacillus sp. S13-E01]|uniref:DUF1934 domain-containing protein n=1 Tax=Cytobacillus sp. S13-E01 TaxID=3031326 RepID=UPI0023D7F487|nr:DUF1934 domain-containing protein [Cytobacillus sp. S13-E01]MDF0726654.1 DUF1934 domain-containing protein [Cytobacillus sp. S13-E01]
MKPTYKEVQFFVDQSLAAGHPIKVKLVTEIRQDNRKQHVAIEANGQYYIKDDATFLRFTERQEAGDVNTIVKISSHGVLILRSGAVKMRQVFIKGKQAIGSYESPYGSFELLTDTNNIEFKPSKHSHRKGNLFLAYLLQMQGDKVGRYTMTITYEEAK